MDHNVINFNKVYQRRLVPEQRKAILEVIANDLTPDTTLGEIVDAAEEIGWDMQFGELCLSELAQALELGAEENEVTKLNVADNEEGFEEEEDGEEEEEERVTAGKRNKKVKVQGRSGKTKKATGKPQKGKKISTKTKKTTSKQAAKSQGKNQELAKKLDKTAKFSKIEEEEDEDLDADLLQNAMSLEQAMEILVPIINKCKQATMQELEEKTGLGRRKLRFHIGQLVRHNLLERHGMGRGTYYTVS